MTLDVIIFIMLQVILIDGILSLDNAAVLGAMAAKLPPNTPAPLAPWLSRILGKNQQDAALKVGLIGAYVGRALMLCLVGFIIAFPLLKILGALYLLNLVAEHFEIYPKIDRYTGIFTFLGKIVAAIKTPFERLGIKNNAGSLSSSLQKLIASPFWRVVISIEIMDLVFSLDNVIAVIALSEHIVIIILGVFISIIIMRFAATRFIRLINFEPLLMHAAYVLILAISIELFLEYLHVETPELLQFTISMAIIIGFIVSGQVGRKLGLIKSKKDEPEETELDEVLTHIATVQNDASGSESIQRR
jgi:tellurite resistance protein TerC